jgi:NAD(P)H-quinone oxidoreductase subunit 5
MQAAAVLVVTAVALKSAQLPFHGWLIQVMEAPTPVSALLHAGVVNIGGFVLIRLSPLMAHAGAAQLLLVVVGLVSALVAALVMTTRVSVKVALAWSTCAQMGFMLVQCGLGLWHLALLHLVAHSLYKAHAFLGAGAAVDGWRQRALSRRPAVLSGRRLAVTGVVAVVVAWLGVAALRGSFTSLQAGSSTMAVWVLAMMVGLSMVPLLARRPTHLAAAASSAARVTGVVALYVGWHFAAAKLMPAHAEAPNEVGWALVGVGFVGLFAVKSTLQALPDGRFARALYRWLFAGLFLDERFTRLTFFIWPPRFEHRPTVSRAITLVQSIEART